MPGMFNPPHPGFIVAKEFESLQISAKEFADEIGVDPESVSKILGAGAPIIPGIADR